jgi:hypothetical protein
VAIGTLERNVLELAADERARLARELLDRRMLDFPSSVGLQIAHSCLFSVWLRRSRVKWCLWICPHFLANTSGGGRGTSLFLIATE